MTEKARRFSGYVLMQYFLSKQDNVRRNNVVYSPRLNLHVMPSYDVGGTMNLSLPIYICVSRDI